MASRNGARSEKARTTSGSTRLPALSSGRASERPINGPRPLPRPSRSRRSARIPSGTRTTRPAPAPWPRRSSAWPGGRAGGARSVRPARAGPCRAPSGRLARRFDIGLGRSSGSSGIAGLAAIRSGAAGPARGLARADGRLGPKLGMKRFDEAAGFGVRNCQQGAPLDVVERCRGKHRGANRQPIRSEHSSKASGNGSAATARAVAARRFSSICGRCCGFPRWPARRSGSRCWDRRGR